MAAFFVTLLLAVILDQFRKVSAFAQLHDQIDRSVLLVYEFVIAAHNVVSLDLPQYLHFIVELLSLFFAHASVICDFPYHFASARYVQHFCYFSKRA